MPHNMAIHFGDQRYGQGACGTKRLDDELLGVVADLQGLKGRDSHFGNDFGIVPRLVSDQDLLCRQGNLISWRCLVNELRYPLASEPQTRRESKRTLGLSGGASLRTCADLKRQPVQVLLIGGLKELAHIFGKLMIFKDSDPGQESSSRTGFQRNGKLEVRLIDMFNPNHRIGNNFKEL